MAEGRGGGVSGRRVVLLMFAAVIVIALITLALYFATRRVEAAELRSPAVAQSRLCSTPLPPPI
jgi:hypothetical protein